MDVLREWMVVVGLLVTALTIPLVWNHVDTARRQNLKQTAYAACITHHGIAGCTRMRPAVVERSTVTLCEMRYDPRECLALREEQ